MICEYRAEGFVGSTESGGVGNGAEEGAHHHGEIVGIMGVEEEEVAGKHDGDVEQDPPDGKHVENDASFSEALKESGAHL